MEGQEVLQPPPGRPEVAEGEGEPLQPPSGRPQVGGPQVAGPEVGLEEDVPTNFSFVPGQRLGSKILVFQNKLFMKDKEKGRRTYYRCRKFKKCASTGYIEDGTFHLNRQVEHV